MDKKLIQELKQKLEGQKKAFEQELQKIATRDPVLKGDWDTKFPKSNGGVGSQALEDAADQVEQYSNALSVEYNLETRLRDINLALGKIEREEYGVCEKCKKPIPEDRLNVFPEARHCNQCQ